MDKKDIWTPEEKRWRRQQIEAAITKLQHSEIMLSDAARLHARQATSWRRFNLVVGLPSAVLAALAGVAAFSELLGSVVVGVTALVSAALTSVLAFFRPDDNRKIHETKAAAYQELLDDVSNYVEIEALDPEVKAGATYLLEDFENRKKLIDKGDPYPERWIKGMPVGPPGLDFSWVTDA